MGQGGSSNKKKRTHFELLKESDKIVRQNGDLSEALVLVEQAIEMVPSYYIAHISKGKLLMKMGDHESAIKSLDEALELSPEDNHAARLYKANALEEMGEFEEALMERTRIPKEVREEVELSKQRRNNSSLRLSNPNTPLSVVSTGTASPYEKKNSSSSKKELHPFSSGHKESGGWYPGGGAEDTASTRTATTADEHFSDIPYAATTATAEGREGEPSTPASTTGSTEGRVRRWDVIDEEDLRRFEAYENQWKHNCTRQRNIHNFLHGKRGHYVHSAKTKRLARERGEMKARLDRYDTMGGRRAGGYAAVGRSSSSLV